MPAKYWLLPLLAVAVLALAGHGPAQASTEQFVVTYVEFLPAKQDPGEQVVEQLAARVVLEGPHRALVADDRVRRAYLGM